MWDQTLDSDTKQRFLTLYAKARDEAIAHLKAGDEASVLYGQWLEKSTIEIEMFEQMLSGTPASALAYVLAMQFSANINFLCDAVHNGDALKATVIIGLLKAFGGKEITATGDNDEEDFSGLAFPATSGKPN